MRIMRALVPALLVGGMLLALAGSASGHRIIHGRSVKASFKPATGPPFNSVTGRVASKAKRCRAKIKVILWARDLGPDHVAGSDRTAKGGFFRIDPPGQFEDGSYYLTVRRRVLAKKRRHRHICPRLETNTSSFTNPVAAFASSGEPVSAPRG